MLNKSLRLFSRSSFRCAQTRFQSSYGSNPSSSSFFSPPRAPAPPAQHVELSGVEFSKPDGSLQVRFRPPKFAPARAPPIGGAQLYRPALEGIITLRLTPASSVANTSDGRVSYDWDASLQINLGVLEILHVVQNSIAASVNVQEAPPRGGGGGQQQQQQQQQRMRLEILPPTSVAAAPTAGSSSAANNNVTQGGGGPNLYRISILSEEGKGVSVSVSQAEVYLLRNLLGTSLPWVTGWMYNLDPSALIPGYHLLPPYQPSPVVNQSQQPSTQQQTTGYTSPPQPSQSQQPRSPGTAAPSSSSPYGGGRPYSPPPSSRSSSSPPQQQQQQSSSSSSYSRPPYPPRNT